MGLQSNMRSNRQRVAWPHSFCVGFSVEVGAIKTFMQQHPSSAAVGTTTGAHALRSSRGRTSPGTRDAQCVSALPTHAAPLSAAPTTRTSPATQSGRGRAAIQYNRHETPFAGTRTLSAHKYHNAATTGQPLYFTTCHTRTAHEPPTACGPTARSSRSAAQTRCFEAH